jgi:hypothetical protein
VTATLGAIQVLIVTHVGVNMVVSCLNTPIRGETRTWGVGSVTLITLKGTHFLTGESFSHDCYTEATSDGPSHRGI